MRLHAIKFGLAAGIVGSTIMLVSSILFRLLWLRRMPVTTPAADQALMQMQQYMSLPWGTVLINTMWIFVSYFFMAWLFAWVYNKLLG